MTLCRAATFEMKLFNVRQREYALLHNKVLFDLADITSHRPDGTSCFDNRNRGVEAICQDYTNEVDGGHLNARGMQRVAKAFWVLMARVSGWQG
jgi:lysophospholipase L1-like esterase